MTQATPEAVATLEQQRQKAADDAEAWSEAWSRFPTVSQDAAGEFSLFVGEIDDTQTG